MPIFVDMIGPSSALDNVVIGGAVCDASKRRPDACWIVPGRVAILEVDESGHFDRIASCEVAKVIDQTRSVQQAYPSAVVAHFRFNPCEFDHRRVSLEDRIARTALDIKLFLASADELRVEVPYVLYYFYPQKSHFQIVHVLQEAAEAVCVLVVQDGAFRVVRDLADIDASWQVPPSLHKTAD
jgi:hypothetical protein